MLNSAEREELEKLRSQMAALEAVLAKPLKVEIEGLEGLKQWSAQIDRERAEVEAPAVEVPQKRPRGMFENIAIWGWGVTIVVFGGLWLLDELVGIR
jgi:hypothetical protein